MMKLTMTSCLNPCFVGICSGSEQFNEQMPASKVVLILVLLEYALGDRVRMRGILRGLVLILVLLEYAPGAYMVEQKVWRLLVLILVLLEYALGAANHLIKHPDALAS